MMPLKVLGAEILVSLVPIGSSPPSWLLVTIGIPGTTAAVGLTASLRLLTAQQTTK
jgi:hypothetical protein